ncbi:dihydrofolate reductase [Enterococcus sp. CSURQ0835]|uniref:dihydrofolate reductase n=1 Tax=Enterococcus sp. CSURQ0835 TaxID=2681394 RepID=UPI001359E996|nr:dihydrofolate reductase [Enterococcus sp. CSURQ0835]
MLIAIWAQAKNGLIGKANRLPWHLPNDLKFFKQMTEHQTLVMGRKTFEGMGSRPLPNRQTIVLTRAKDYIAPAGVIVLHDKQAVLDYAARCEQDVFIAGGAAVYEEFIPNCDRLYRTLIDAEFTGDAYFPEIDWTRWHLVEKKVGEKDANNPYPYYFETYH